MSPQHAQPRSDRCHEVVTGNVLERFAMAEGWTPVLPIPIERIIEVTYRLTILCEQVDEAPGEEILGVLRPSLRQIVLNEAHVDLFDSVIGPERFTAAQGVARLASAVPSGVLPEAGDEAVRLAR